jgi:predicted transposase/invertase (TIGR01784 family)
MGQINDISFTVDNRLVVLIEHQSTINPNMPLRLLMYLARVYEKITDRRKIYKSSLEKIPVPECIVLYNGVQPYPDRAELKLSEAVQDALSLRAVGRREGTLELTVQVYNINKGHNEELARKSKTLDGYSALVEMIREQERSLPREEAIRAAIKRCLEQDILKSFLETHSSEVYNMLITEWNIDEAKVAWYEEGLEKGLERGMEEGREEGIENVTLNALAMGLSVEVIQQMTGLDAETIERLKSARQ